MKLRIMACMVIVGSIAASNFATAQAPPVFELKWGSPGSGPGQFRFPTGIASDGAGNIYVADHENKRVQKFSNNGVYLGELDSAPSGPAAFGFTSSCAVDGAGNLYLTDSRGYIDVFDASLAFVRSWPATAAYLALDPTEQYLYATLADTIMKYDAATGARVHAWRYAGTPYVSHYSFGVGPSGAIYVAGVIDGNHVAKFSPDGVLLNTWGGGGTGSGTFNGSRGVAVDLTENVYVGDGNGRIQKFTADGLFLAAWGSPGAGDGQFSPDTFALTTDQAGNVFVLDHGLTRVQKFGDAATSVRKSTWGALKARYR